MNSSRLPGKVMKPILNKPMLGHLLDRLLKTQLLDDIVVATSTNQENDIIENYCKQRNISCYRGSENDVLDRMLRALQSKNASVGVEIFGDCPLIDPVIVDNIINIFLDSYDSIDFVSNDLQTTYTPGMEVEVFHLSTLIDSYKRVKDMAIREHGTLFIRQNPDIYRIKNVVAPPEYNMPELELEVDTKEDFEVITKIIENFANKDYFSLSDIISFLDMNEDISAINRHIPRRWKKYRDDRNA